MNNVKAPYNLSSLTSERATQALQSMDVLRTNIGKIMSERTRVKAALEKLPFVVRVCHSDANFLLFQMKDHAQATYKAMADTFGVVSRYRGTEKHCEECIRVTVGTKEDNEAFLEAIGKAYGMVSGVVAL